MGASANEIDREINETRAHLDENLDELQARAASGAKRVAVMAAVGLLAGLAVVGAVVLVYRRVHKPSLAERVQDILPDVLVGLPDEVRSRIRRGPVKVVITQDDEEAGPTAWESIGRKIGPTLVSTAVGAVMSRFVDKTSDESSAEE